MIRIEGLRKTFSDFEISNVNIDIRKGEYFVVLGPSGSGKTILLEMIAGLTKPDSGKIYGVKEKGIGLIYQDYMLFPHMNVFNNIAYGLRIKKEEKNKTAASVQTVAEELEITHLLHRSVQTLSGGEKQRTAIARAMVLDPDVYLFDEPTAALDLSTKIKTHRLFMKLHRDHRATVIHVTHDFEEALALGDRIAVLMDGRIIQIDTPEAVFNNPSTRKAADFMGYKNVFSGKIENNKIDVRGNEILTLVQEAKSAYIAIRSSDIFLSKEKILSSARNSFYGKVFKVIQRGSHVEVMIDTGVLFHVDITYLSLREMDIKPGTRLWVTFKTSAVKVFEH